AVLDRGERMVDARRRIPGRLDHHLDGLVGAGRITGVREPRAGDPPRVPSDGAAGKLRTLRIEIGEHRDVDPGDGRHLRKEHRAELAGPDQAAPHGFVCCDPCGELVLQAHAMPRECVWWKYCRAAHWVRSLSPLAGRGSG